MNAQLSSSHTDENTRKRVLEAATELFATKGYNRTSIREICQLAEANVAAVHYHFNDKASLYREVAKPAAHLTNVPEALRKADTTLREALESFYRPLATSIEDRSITPHVRMIWMREQIQPSHVLDQECADFFRPRHSALCHYLASYCKAEAVDDAIQQLALSLSGMAMILYVKLDVARSIAPSLFEDDNATESTLDRLIGQAETLIESEKKHRQRVHQNEK